ncbi:MAG TPA: DUF3667 domain-containing protein [Pyrinomonadaceae bacterium]|nr:DUF3667 domain-containing protein [Pyrinomonadaceae bacterium]
MNAALRTAEPAAAEGGEAHACANCGEPLRGPYCHGCGEKSADGRDLSLRHFAAEAAQELTSVERSKLLRTARALLFRPGLLSVEYFSGRRTRYLKPLNLCLAVFALSLFFYSAYKPVSMYDLERFVRQDQTGAFEKITNKWAERKGLPREALVERIGDKWQGFMSLFQLLNVILFALLLQLVYLFSRRYFVEHLVFAMHYVAFSVLTVVMLFPVYLLTGINPTPVTKTLAVFKWLVDLVYMFFAVRAFYGHRPAAALPLSLLLIGGYFVCYVTVYVGALLAAAVSVAKM